MTQDDSLHSEAGSRLLPPRALVYALAVQLPLAAWSVREMPSPWALAAGAFLVLAGAALNVWSVRLFDRHHAGVCPFSPVREIITGGPYRITRNPMYVGLVVIAAAPVVAVSQPANLFAPVALAMWLHFRYVLPEEAFLRQRFGAAFDRHAARVPRWLVTVGAPAAEAE